MGMSTHVYGFRPPDETWQAMKAVWDSCHNAGVPVPPDVEKFFDWEPPSAEGIKVDLVGVIQRRTDSYNEDGYQIEIAKLPQHITHIRFVNAW